MPAIKLELDGTPHTHCFVRRKSLTTNRPTDTFACEHPVCTTSFHRKLLVGKETLCAVCKQNKFLLTADDLRRARPRCIECSQKQSVRQQRQIAERLKELGIV